MATLNKKLVSSFQSPEWATFFTPSQYADFIRLVGEDMKKRALSWKEEDGHAIVRQGGGKAQRVSLLNLAQICHMQPAAGWHKSVAEFFDSALHFDSHIDELVSGLSDVNKVRNRIKLRLHPDSYHGTPGADGLLLRDEAEGLVSLVVCDMKTANFSVPKVVLSQWQMDEEELYALALKNTLEQEEVTHAVMPPGPSGAVCEGIESQSNYTASHLLRLEHHMKNVSGFGVIVGVPNRHMLFLYRIRDEKLLMHGITDVQHMTGLAYRDGPGSISQDLFWWRQGRPLRRLPVRRSQQRGGRLEVHADQEFYTEVMLPLSKGN